MLRRLIDRAKALTGRQWAFIALGAMAAVIAVLSLTGCEDAAPKHDHGNPPAPAATPVVDNPDTESHVAIHRSGMPHRHASTIGVVSNRDGSHSHRGLHSHPRGAGRYVHTHSLCDGTEPDGAHFALTYPHGNCEPEPEPEPDPPPVAQPAPPLPPAPSPPAEQPPPAPTSPAPQPHTPAADNPGHPGGDGAAYRAPSFGCNRIDNLFLGYDRDVDVIAEIEDQKGCSVDRGNPAATVTVETSRWDRWPPPRFSGDGVALTWNVNNDRVHRCHDTDGTIKIRMRNVAPRAPGTPVWHPTRDAIVTLRVGWHC